MGWRMAALNAGISPKTTPTLAEKPSASAMAHRGTEETAEIRQRLKTGLREMTFRSKYDYVVINKNLSQTVRSVENIIESERLKSGRFDYASWRKSKGVT